MSHLASTGTERDADDGPDGDGPDGDGPDGDGPDGDGPDGDGPDEAAFRRAVGKRIRVWRVLHDLSQDDLATAAGVTRNFVRVK